MVCGSHPAIIHASLFRQRNDESPAQVDRQRNLLQGCVPGTLANAIDGGLHLCLR
jgi:hypothetical protein